MNVGCNPIQLFCIGLVHFSCIQSWQIDGCSKHPFSEQQILSSTAHVDNNPDGKPAVPLHWRNVGGRLAEMNIGGLHGTTLPSALFPQLFVLPSRSPTKNELHWCTQYISWFMISHDILWYWYPVLWYLMAFGIGAIYTKICSIYPILYQLYIYSIL